MINTLRLPTLLYLHAIRYYENENQVSRDSRLQELGPGVGSEPAKNEENVGTAIVIERTPGYPGWGSVCASP